MPRRRQKGTGSVRQRGRGWQLAIRVPGRPNPITEVWDRAPTPAELLAWSARQRHTQAVPAPEAGSFAADVAAYLRRIAAKPTVRQIAAHLELWLEALGRDRPRSTITAAEIDTVIQRWLVTPTVIATGQRGRPSGPQGLAPATIRKRCVSLQSFFTRLDGKQAVNPVRGATRPRAPKPQPRGRDYATIARILAAMPTQRSTKPGAVVEASLAPIRAAVIAYTGLPPHQVQGLGPTDLDFTAGTIRVAARAKGQGVEARVLPLGPHGLAALRAFHQAQAYGAFPIEALNQSFKRAAKRCGIDPRTITLYDLRHSFGEQVYRVTGDLATVGRLMGHAPGSPVTARYAMGANDDVNRLAVAAFGQAVAGLAVSPPVSPAQASAISVKVRKSKRIKHLREAS